MITSLLYHLYIIIHNRLKNPCAVPPLYEKKERAIYSPPVADRWGGEGEQSKRRRKLLKKAKKERKRKRRREEIAARGNLNMI